MSTLQPGSAEELAAFEVLQEGLRPWLESYTVDPDGDHATVVVPSMTFDRQLLEKVTGVEHYEERLLATLISLRRPRMRLVYCTSTPVSETIVDYYLDLITGVPRDHSRERLTMVSCDDPSPRPLTEKLLERPRRLAEIRAAVQGAQSAVIICMNTTGLERTLALALGLPLYGNPPELDSLGSKSGSRELFRAAGVDLPSGRERLGSLVEAAEAVADLMVEVPGLRRAVVKVEEGFSGEGNALLRLDGIDASSPRERAARVLERMRTSLQMVGTGITLEQFEAKFTEMGGVVEEYLEGTGKVSPSAQARVTPSGDVEPLSTHDQLLAGENAQVFQGSVFPANVDYRLAIQQAGVAVGRELRDRGAMGRYAVDFVVVPQPDGSLRSAAIEINLRRGGTTHPMVALEILTSGYYDAGTGDYYAPSGRRKCYVSTDNCTHPNYRQLNSRDLLDLAVLHHINYDPVTETGAVFHMMGALSPHGKVGMTCIADDLDTARAIDRRVRAMLDEATGVVRD